jgi:hypothetical protein
MRQKMNASVNGPVETIFNQYRILHILTEVNKDSLEPHPLMILL